jgi:hypothetical protein
MPLAAAARALCVGLPFAMCCAAAPAQRAPSAAASGIYSCIDDKGRRITSDRPIPECTAREQRVLNRDGSLRTVHPPTLTADERAELEARDRRAAQERAAQAEILRRDRNLLARYPDEARHRQARENALDTVKLAAKASEQRLKDLAAERKPLLDEAEFYKGRTLPPKLKMQLEANEAATEAQRNVVATQEAELVRINRLYDIELERLKRLWAGAKPGSLGPLPAVGSEVRSATPAVTSTR